MGQAELHLHLEGSIEPDTFPLLNPEISQQEIAQYHAFRDFAGFIACFRWISQQLRGPQEYALITRRLCERLQGEGITYAEVTLAAGVVIWKEQDLDAIYQAVRSESQRSAVEILWNLDSIRHLGPELAMQVAEFAAGQVGNGVISLGIGGDEIRGPAEWFGDVYRTAAASGLRLTAHAGETAGPQSIWAALEIGAERIGHGIRAVDDPLLLQHLAKHQIPLEVSITSNVCTGAVASLAEHPIRRLFEAGVPLTLNTDDPGIFCTTLAGEFRVARDQFGFTEEELDQVRANAWRFRFPFWPKNTKE